MLRRGGTCVLVGIPPGAFPLSIFEVVVKGLTVRGSIVGTRHDLREALQFVGDGKVAAVVEHHPLEQVNAVIDAIERQHIKGRAVLRMT
jgi:alcohol dehydrogenase, propanol-preferring